MMGFLKRSIVAFWRASCIEGLYLPGAAITKDKTSGAGVPSQERGLKQGKGLQHLGKPQQARL